MRLATLVLMLSAWAAPLAAVAQEPIVLRFANPGPPTSPTWPQWFAPWIERVEKDAGGAIRMQVFFGNALANQGNVYDRIASGVADLGTGVVSPLRGKLAGTFVMELPSDANGKEGSAGMWRIFETGLTASEWRENRPLTQWVYPQNSLHFRSPVAKVDDVKGMKLATVSKIDADILTRMGAAPVTVTPAELYEVVNRGVASGAVIGWLAVTGYKLHEVTSYHLNAQLGSGGGFMAMNKDSYARLPEKARAAIDRHSGYAAAKDFGAALDRIYRDQEEAVKKMPRQTVARLSPAEHERWIAFGKPIEAEWLKATPNGAAILAAFRAEVAKVRAER